MQWRAVGADEWSEAVGSPTGREGQWEVRLDGLTADTPYDYEIVHEGVADTRRSFRTAPDGAGDVRAAFVADTGIVGRRDGLTTGTERVISEIAELEPLVVLGGGDYAYLNSEDRYADQEEAMDAWLAQMQPLISSSAFMPTWGNHEVLLEEDVDRWADRFATPSGSPDGLSYSFEVAGVHFVALLAYEQQIDDATLQWLDDDLADARARGVREVVPYLHRNLYGNGTVHAPSGDLAAQITPVFEAHGVRLVLTAHDQSYERTFPMVGGAATLLDRRDCFVPADGIVYVKTSPGGKLSSENWDFSPFEPGEADPEIAVRANSLHHFSTLDIDAAGDVTVTTYGLVGDDSEPVVVDRFRSVADASTCAPGPLVEPSSLLFDTEQSRVERITVPPGATLTSDADWLTVDASGLVTVDELPSGRHAATITVTSPDGSTTGVAVVAVVPFGDPFDEIVVAAPGDVGERALDGTVVGGEVAIEFRPRETLAEVRFELDGEPVAEVTGRPYDWPSATDGEPGLLDTETLRPGYHTISAIAIGANGTTRTVSARFLVDRAVETPQVIAGSPVDTAPSADGRSSPPASAPSLRTGTSTSGWSASVGVFLLIALAGMALAAVVVLFRRSRATGADPEADPGAPDAGRID